MVGPGSRIAVHQALEGGLQIFIDPLGLSIGLGVEAGRSTDVAPTRQQNSLQKAEVNWGPRSEMTSVGNPWRRKTCWRNSSAVSLAEGSLVRGMKWAKMGFTIYEGEDNGVALGCRQTSHKVQRDMRPVTMGDGQGVQEAGRWAARGLILVTNKTGVDEAPDILKGDIS